MAVLKEMDPARAEYAPPDRLQQLPSWLAGQVAMHARRLVADELAQDGARRQHFIVMSALAEAGAVSQAALGRRLWGDLPADELSAAGRLLTTILARANAELGSRPR